MCTDSKTLVLCTDLLNVQCHLSIIGALQVQRGRPNDAKVRDTLISRIKLRKL